MRAPSPADVRTMLSDICTNSGADVSFDKLTDFTSADLEHVTFRSVDLSKCCFRESSNLDKAEFDHVEWARWPPEPLRR